MNREGQSNPNNFNGHRKAMIDLSLWVPALTAAWVLTRDQQYASHAISHLRAWFVTPATRKNPNLEYAQGSAESRRGAITGLSTRYILSRLRGLLRS